MGPTGVYQEKLQRPVRDMEAEKAQELLNLPPRIAYTMFIQEREPMCKNLLLPPKASRRTPSKKAQRFQAAARLGVSFRWRV